MIERIGPIMGKNHVRYRTRSEINFFSRTLRSFRIVNPIMPAGKLANTPVFGEVRMRK